MSRLRPRKRQANRAFLALISLLPFVLSGMQQAFAQELSGFVEADRNTETTRLEPIRLEQDRTRGAAHFFGLWTPFVCQIPLCKSGRLQIYHESSPRFSKNMERMDTYLERNHLIYALTKRSDIQVGHVYARSFFPRGITVNAISSQIGASLPFGRNALYGRLRFENRFFEYTHGSSNRLRTQARLTRRLIGDRVYAFVMEELFFNLNSIERGPSQGLDQNRFMSGVGFRIYKQLRFDVAYLQQYINRKSGLPDLVNNILFMQTSQAF